MKTKTKPKEIYISPETEIVLFISEGIVCESENGDGEDMEWD